MEATPIRRVNDIPNTPRLWPRFVVVLVPLTVWILLVPSYLARSNGVTADSASYIECAESIVAGRGFQVRPFGGLDPKLWQPLDCFPPGYSLLTAGLMRLGVSDAYLAARWVSVGCALFFLLFALAFYARALSPGIAVLLGIVLSATPSMLTYETMCLSESAYMLLATFSLLALLEGTADVQGSIVSILIAGLAAGCAWCVRNVGVALILASVSYLAARQILEGGATTGAQGTEERAVRDTRHWPMLSIGVWAIGWLMGGGWLVVWNYRTFGAVSPYRMPSRELSAGLMTAVAIAGIAAITVAAWLGRHRLACLVREHRSMCLLWLFLLFHVGVIIMAHCVYRMGEAVQSFRFYAPVYWIALWLAVLGVRRLGVRWQGGIAVVAAITALVASLATASHRSPQATVDRCEAASLGKEVPAGKLVLADCVETLRVFGHINARQLPDKKYGQRTVTWDELRQASREGRLWGIVVRDRAACAEGRFGEVLRQSVLSPNGLPQLRKTQTATGLSVWQCVP